MSFFDQVNYLTLRPIPLLVLQWLHRLVRMVLLVLPLGPVLKSVLWLATGLVPGLLSGLVLAMALVWVKVYWLVMGLVWGDIPGIRIVTVRTLPTWVATGTSVTGIT